MTRKPLEGIVVVALEQAVAAPYCSSRLANAGARVIKVERPEGDFARNYDHAVFGESSYFVWINRGKESIAPEWDEAIYAEAPATNQHKDRPCLGALTAESTNRPALLTANQVRDTVERVRR